MLTGDRTKTMNLTVDYWWETENPSRDMQLGNPVGAWIGKNSKVLDRKRASEVVQLVREQFDYLVEIEVRHAQLQHAKWKK